MLPVAVVSLLLRGLRQRQTGNWHFRGRGHQFDAALRVIVPIWPCRCSRESRRHIATVTLKVIRLDEGLGQTPFCNLLS